MRILNLKNSISSFENAWEFQIPTTGRRDDKTNKNRKLTMVTASNAENSANKTQLLNCFCSWVHYHLLNPTAKGIEQLATSCQENGLQAESPQSVFGSL